MEGDRDIHPSSTRRIVHDRQSTLEVAGFVGGLIIFLVLLYEMLIPPAPGRFLGPPLTAVVGAILLWPLRKQQTARGLLLAGGFLMLVWFLDRLSGILTPFAVIYLLAFLFNPVVDRLDKTYRIPRWLSSLGITLLLIGVFTLFVLLLVPKIVNQIEELATRILNSVGYLREWLLTTTLLDELDDSGFVDKEWLIEQITVAIRTQAAGLTTGIPMIVQNLVGYIGSILGLLTMLAIVPVVLYYTLKDYPHIKARLVELFPTFGGRRDYLVQAGGVVGNYLRGQITISVINAFNVSVALFIFGVPFSLLIGILAGILNMVPNLGAFATSVIGILIAIIFGDPWFIDALVVFLVLTGEGLLEQTILTPKILSSHVGLHPVLIILSLFVFGYLMGIFGLLIAVPATALVMTFYKTFRHELTIELAPESKKPPSRFLFRRVLRDETKKADDSHLIITPSDVKKSEEGQKE